MLWSRVIQLKKKEEDEEEENGMWWWSPCQW
jgi:hypothetical protein